MFIYNEERRTRDKKMNKKRNETRKLREKLISSVKMPCVFLFVSSLFLVRGELACPCMPMCESVRCACVEFNEPHKPPKSSKSVILHGNYGPAHTHTHTESEDK